MRSKALLVANVMATIYAGILLWWFGGTFVEFGGVDMAKVMIRSFSVLGDLSSDANDIIVFLYTVLGLLIAHIAVFTLGALIGWIAYLSKKSGAAKFAAVLYLIGTVCFPIYILFGLPITIVGFIGGGKQKKINISNTAE